MSDADRVRQLRNRKGTQPIASALLPACVLRQLPGSEGARLIAFDNNRHAERDQSPSAWPRAWMRRRRRRCLGVVWQVRLSVAPHVIEGTATLPKVKAGGQGASHEAFRTANRLLDAVSLR